jgi:hypothetical protein
MRKRNRRASIVVQEQLSEDRTREIHQAFVLFDRCDCCLAIANTTHANTPIALSPSRTPHTPIHRLLSRHREHHTRQYTDCCLAIANTTHANAIALLTSL